MAIQVVGQAAPRGKSKAAHFAEAVSGIAEAGAGAYERHTQARLAQSKMSEENKAIKEAYGIDLSGVISPKERQAILAQELKSQGQEKLLQKKTEGIGNVLKQYGMQQPSSVGKALKGEGELEPEPEIGTPEQQQLSWADFPDEEIAKIKMFDHDAGVTIENAKNRALEQRRHEEKLANTKLERQEEREHKEKLLTRAEEMRIAEPIIKEADEDLQKIPELDQALEDIFTAAPGVGIRDWLADVTGIEPLRSNEGVLFKTGVKDYFLGDIKKVGARPNQWIEQQLLQALPLAGRTPQSNMITAEGMKFKIDTRKRRSEIIKQLADEDRSRPDKPWVNGLTLNDRANKLMKPYVEMRQKELANRIKDIKQGKVEYKPPPTNMIDVIGPNGEPGEVHMDQVHELPEGWSIA